jgi:signal transduction histidine kinase
MPLATFILEHIETILIEWERFARSILPATKGLSVESLRDHAREMLIVIVHDMQTAQSAIEQREKSEGRRGRREPNEDSAAETHAGQRVGAGFTLNEVVSEYRALRASVIRLWTKEMGQADRNNLDELTRFNEAIDEALCESIARYTLRMDRARDLLLGALGHDLRNPLGAILQSAQVLLRTETLEARPTQAAVRIMNSGTRMKGMISDLLDFASTRLGARLPLSVAPMNMHDACRAISEEICALHPDRNVDIKCEGELSGRWDGDRVAQMLSNLLGNAIRHGSANGPIRVLIVGSAMDVRIEVHNEGPPVPMEKRRNIFEPLTRGAAHDSNPHDSNRSTGLGLYIACEIAKAHGGTLELARSDEKGTVFAVCLPKDSSQSGL